MTAVTNPRTGKITYTNNFSMTNDRLTPFSGTLRNPRNMLRSGGVVLSGKGMKNIRFV